MTLTPGQRKRLERGIALGISYAAESAAALATIDSQAARIEALEAMLKLADRIAEKTQEIKLNLTPTGEEGPLASFAKRVEGPDQSGGEEKASGGAFGVGHRKGRQEPRQEADHDADDEE